MVTNPKTTGMRKGLHLTEPSHPVGILYTVLGTVIWLPVRILCTVLGIVIWLRSLEVLTVGNACCSSPSPAGTTQEGSCGLLLT